MGCEKMEGEDRKRELSFPPFLCQGGRGERRRGGDRRKRGWGGEMKRQGSVLLANWSKENVSKVNIKDIH